MCAVVARRRFVRCVVLMLTVCGYNSDAVTTGIRTALQKKHLVWVCSYVRFAIQRWFENLCFHWGDC
jgi:hypothetical protein